MSSTLTPTQYVSNGMRFNVTPDRLEEFMQKYPAAKLASEAPMQHAATTQIYYTEDGKQFRVSPDQIDKFKAENPTGRTIEEWNTHIKDEQDKYKKELEENKRKHAEALATESERVQKSVDKINSDFENHFENKEDENYIKLKDASYQEKAKYLKEIELNEKYSSLDNGELSFWGNMKNLASEIINNPSLVPGQMVVNATSASAQQKSAYDAELEIQRLNTLEETTNQYTDSKEYEKIMQEKLELHAKLDAAYRDVNIVDIQGGVNYLNGAIDRIKSRKISELGQEYIITNEEGEEIVDTENPMYQEELIKIQDEEIEITREDFDSDLDFNLYNKLQDDRNILDDIKANLTEQLGLEQSVRNISDDAAREEVLNQAYNLTDYNNNPEYKELLEKLQLKLEAAGTTLSLEEIAEKISSGIDKEEYWRSEKEFGGVGHSDFVHGGVNKLGSILEENIENAYIDQIKTDYKVQENWMTDGYKVTVGLDNKSTMFQGRALITKPTKGLIDRAALSLGNAEDYIQSKDKTVLVDGVEIDAQQAAKNEAFQDLITSDSTIKLLMNNYAKEATPILKNYKKELEENYDLSKKENVIEVNRLLAAKQQELTIDKLYDSEEWKKITTSYGMALDNVAQQYDSEFKRNDSWVLWGLDKLRLKGAGETDYIPINDTLADLLEGTVSGVEGIRSSIADKAWGSIAGNRFRANRARADVLDQQLKDEDFTKEDKVYWHNGKWNVWDEGEDEERRDKRTYNAGELSKELKENKDYWQKEIVEQIEDVAESEEWLSVFKQADYSDGISIGDAALTVGQALPHIGIAAAGALTGNPMLAYLGTATMFAQMYGDNYWSAIENNLDKTGFSKEKLKQAYPEKSDEEIEELYIKAATSNLQSGQGANMAHSAAMAAVQTALETYGAQQVVGGTQKALAGKIPGNPFHLGNLFKTSMDDIGSGILRGLIHQGGSSLEEFGTEFMQEIVGQISTAQQGGLESTALIDVSAALQAGIGGAITGFMLPFSGSMYRLGSTAIRQAANDIALEYAPDGKRAQSVAISNAWFEDSKKKLDKEYKNKLDDPAKKQEYYDKISALSNSYNASVKLGLLGKGKDNFTQTMTAENRRAVLDGYVEIENLQNQIEGLDKNDPQLLILKEQLKEVQYDTAEIIKAEKTTARVTKIMKDIGKAKEVVILDDLSAKERKALRKSQGFGDRTTGIFGEDGKIYIDKNLSAQLKSGNTAAHELLHKVMFNTLYDVDAEGKIQGKNVAQGLVNALDGYLDQLDPENTRGGKEFAQRLKIYKDRPNTIKAEEKLMLFADAIENGDIKFDENVFTKIGDVVRRFLQDVGITDVKFNSGRDVYNFLKDYNVAIKKGKFGDALTNVMEEGAEVGENIERITDDENLGSMRKSEAAATDSYAETDTLINDPDFDLENSFDQKRALKIAAPVIEATTQRLWDPKSLLTRDEFKKTLEKEYLDSLQEYDADRDTGMNAGKSISNKFNLRAAKVAKDNIGKVEAESLDAEQAKQVPDTTKQKDFDAPLAKEDKQRKKKLTVENKVVDREVAGEIKNQIKENTRSTISVLLNKGKSVEDIVKALDKEAKEQEFKDVKGKKTLASKAYESFIDNLINNKFIRNISVADMKSRFKNLFNVKETGKIPQKGISPNTGKTTNWNKQVFSVTAPSDIDLKEYFIPKNLKNLTPGEKDTYTKRANSLFNLIAKDIKIESLQELKNDKDYMKNLDILLKQQNSPLTATQFIDAIDQKLDRRNLEDTSLDTVRASEALPTQDKKKAEERKAKRKSEALRSNREKIAKQKTRDVGVEGIVPRYKRGEKIKYKKIREKSRRLKDGTIRKAGVTEVTAPASQVPAYAKIEQSPESIRKRKRNVWGHYSVMGDSVMGSKTMTGNNSSFYQFKEEKSYDGKEREHSLDKDLNSTYDTNMFYADARLDTAAITPDMTFQEFKDLPQHKDVDWDGNVIPSGIDIEQIFNNAQDVAILKKQGVPMLEVEPGVFKLNKKAANSIDIEYEVDGKKTSVLKEAQKEQIGSKSYRTWSPKTFIKKISDPQWRKQQVDKIKVLYNLAQAVQLDLKNNPENLGYWTDWFAAVDNNSNHPLRALAPIRFFSKIKNLVNIAEHSMPVNQVSSLILDMAMRGEVENEFDFIKKHYRQGQVRKADDDKLKRSLKDGTDLTKDMGTQFYDLENPNTWKRYVEKEVNGRDSQGGINLNTYETWDETTGKRQTIAQSEGVGLTEAQYTMPDGSLNPNIIQQQNNTLYDMFTKGEPTAKVAKSTLTSKANINTQRAKTVQGKKIVRMNEGIFKKNSTSSSLKQTMLNSQETAAKAENLNAPLKGISVFDMDDTLAITKEKVLVTLPDGTTTKLNATEFAQQAETLQQQGATFDFSEFVDVKGAKKGPLADLALKRQGKFGSGDIYVLTARPQASASAIKIFLDGIGLNIPIENIIGLEDGSPQAKADWVLSKTAEGYNDFYFADDSKMNVDAVKQVLDQVDVKSKVQVARANEAANLDKEFNEILEETTGMKAGAEYSDTRAKLEGKKKDKGLLNWLGNQVSITASAEDFLGLLYDVLGTGEKGTQHLKWIHDNLIDVYNKAEQEILSAKVTVANDFAALKKQFPSLRSRRGNNPLMNEIGIGPYTKSHAIRVYNWVKQGIDMTQHGMSKRDIDALVKAVENDNELRVFADEVVLIQKDSKYPPPTKNWQAGDIATDITNSLEKSLRRKAMAQFDRNVDIIFSEKNKRKLRALYGDKWVSALEDSLRRMRSGSNRPVYVGGGSRIVNELLNWLNGSVGAIMFLNMRSGLLQLISNVNFINWGDNNIVAAAKAFVSKSYWPTVLKLMNSDYLVNRRDGLKINVNEAELANAANQGGIKGVIAFLLDKGFIITRIMDSLAIATGGATFFINRKAALLKRINKDTGKLHTEAEAETKAYNDFYAIAEESQQSSNPSKISQQQASLAGRVILSFQNVTMQYNRLTKKAIRDLYNRRRRPGQTQREADLSNMSKIVYYMGVQNVIFHSLQKLLMAGLFDDEEDEKTKDKTAEIANGMLDSLLFGLGFGGAAISTIKNVILELVHQHGRKTPEYEEAVWNLFDFSPVLDNKVRKMRSGFKTFSWNKEEIRKRGWSLDNPAYLAVAQIIAAGTNIPIDRVLRKSMNLRAAMDEETRNWQRVALVLGWDTWSVGLPYWGLESTIKREAEDRAKAKLQYKQDIKKLKAMGYKKGEDNGPDVIEVEHFTGIIQYWSK